MIARRGRDALALGVDIVGRIDVEDARHRGHRHHVDGQDAVVEFAHIHALNFVTPPQGPLDRVEADAAAWPLSDPLHDVATFLRHLGLRHESGSSGIVDGDAARRVWLCRRHIGRDPQGHQQIYGKHHRKDKRYYRMTVNHNSRLPPDRWHGTASAR